MPSVIGWDIGGAHLKAARAEDGKIVAVLQLPCRPHLGVAQIEDALRDAGRRLGDADRHGVTMTAELSDAFPDRASGVAQIAAICAREIGANRLRFYAGAFGFVESALAAERAREIASANWRASADLLARHCENALFVDMGSTTTDIAPILDHTVAAQGDDDASRLASGELVYTGLLRSSPVAGLTLAPLAGRLVPLVDEQFATMADAHRLLGNVPGGADEAPTPDGRGKGPDASRARLARLVGCDAKDHPPSAWEALAACFARAQLRRIEDAIALLASRTPALAHVEIIGAGVGRGVIAGLAAREGRVYRDIGEFLPRSPAAALAADCTPACAVALLASGAK